MSPRPSPRRKSPPRLESEEAYEARTSSRLQRVGLALAAIHLLLIGRLAYIHIGRHEELSKESLTRWRAPRTVRSPRGLIYDRSGALLVQNEPGYSIQVDPNEWFKNNSTNPLAKDSPEDRRAHVLEVLERFYADKELGWVRKLDLDKANPTLKRLPVRELVPWIPEEQRKAIQTMAIELSPRLPEPPKRRKGGPLPQASDALSGISYPESSRRRALSNTLASHVLGFTDESGERAFRGIELSQQTTLVGQPGKITTEFDRLGTIPGTEQVHRKAVPGSHLYLTLDAELQHDVEQTIGEAVARHKAESGVAIVLDARTGEVLAMASAPDYDINAVRLPQPGKKSSLQARINWAIELPYEPGSTLKPLTIAAALEEREVSPNSTFYCNGARKIGRYTIHCAPHGQFQHGHGTQDLSGVLAHSCNLATAACSTLLGDQKLHSYLQDFGIGEKTKLGLPNEAPGTLHDPLKRAWEPITLANVSFGQGVSVTPLQLAAAYTVFVDGHYHPPQLIKAVRNAETGVLQELPPRPSIPVLSEKTAAAMRAMLGSVVERGTGQLAQLDQYTAGGKTGTAQMANEGRRGYSGRFVASFIGMAPLQKPQFVILTMIRDPKNGDHYGGSVAGPLFKQIAERALLLRRVPHDRDPQNGKKKRSTTAVIE